MSACCKKPQTARHHAQAHATLQDAGGGAVGDRTGNADAGQMQRQSGGQEAGKVSRGRAGRFGGMGLTTNLFPALTLGSGSAGQGITSDNVSPMNLVYVRKVGYGVREVRTEDGQLTCTDIQASEPGPSRAGSDALRQILNEAIQVLNGPETTRR